MTSCDDGYAKLVPVQLLSIADNLVLPPLGYEVHFFLFYNRVSDESIDFLQRYSASLGIVFHKIYIADIELYQELASRGTASTTGFWPYEAYFSIECHKYLPLEVDRILYIDAADVLIIGDIDEYYFCDFENNSLLVTSIRYKADKNGNFVTLDGDDLSDEEHLPGILRGLFNSGSYMINVDKLRRDGSSVNDFIVFKNEIAKVFPEKQDLYFGDQGLLAAAFAGDIKYFGYPETKNLWYQPYNFCVWFFDRAAEICGGNPWYTPRILHFAGGIKPWNFTKENEKDIKPGQWPFYKIYMLYANQVPLVTI